MLLAEGYLAVWYTSAKGSPTSPHQFLINPSLVDLSLIHWKASLPIALVHHVGRKRKTSQSIFKTWKKQWQFQYFVCIKLDGHILVITSLKTLLTAGSSCCCCSVPKQVFAFIGIPFKICIALGKYFCALQLSLVRCLWKRANSIQTICPPKKSDWGRNLYGNAKEREKAIWFFQHLRKTNHRLKS